MRCLITGTDGFVGKNLLKRLIKDGHHIDKLSVKFDDFDYSEDLDKRVKECDVIFHIGAISDVNLQDYNKMLKYNFHFSKILFDLAKKYNKQVVYSSSSAVYGNGELPENIYAWSKYLAEQYGLQTVENFVALRYFNVFGPGEEHKDNMQSLILRIYALSGKYIRNPSIYALSSFLLNAIKGRPFSIDSTRPIYRSYAHGRNWRPKN